MPSNNDIVSFFFLGTAHHRATRQDVLTSFYDLIKKSGGATHLFDGVGSSPQHLGTEHPMPGRYVYDPTTDTKLIPRDESLTGVRELMKKLTGVTAGDGMDELLFEGIQYLENLIKNNHGVMPKTVNLHGYSRGADACVRLANLLDSLYPDVEVNLFLIDHVPGPGRADDPASYTIPANVKRLQSTIMLHEYTPGFAPQDKVRYVFANPTSTKASIQVYPGSHGTATRLTSNQKTNDVPILLHDSLLRFARETGSLPDDSAVPTLKVLTKGTAYEEREATSLSDIERFHYYNQVKKNWRYYCAVGNLSSFHSAGLVSHRKVLTEHIHYSENHHLFINQEHGELFQRFYPALYDWFLLNHSNPTVTSDDVIRELEILAQQEPDFHNNFCHICQIEDLENPQPCAMRQRKLVSSNKPLVHDELSYLQHSLTSIINYQLHHMGSDTPPLLFAMNQLNKALYDAEKCAKSSDAIRVLRQGIFLATSFLEVRAQQESYLYQQLLKLNINADEYIISIQTLLRENLTHNEQLDSDERQFLTRVIEILDELAADNQMDKLYKLQQARTVVKETSIKLQYPTNEETLVRNIIASAYESFNAPKQFSRQKFISSLNELSTPGFSDKNIANDLAKQFNSYHQRTVFWYAVKKFLSDILSIEVPIPLSVRKANIAAEMRGELQTLHKQGQGNDLVAVSKILAKGQHALQTIYLHHKGIHKGELDKIFDKSLGIVRAEIDFLTIPTNQATLKIG
ncbi:DUF5621 domain-containing protein [Legionella cardiaca]|uniref:DUF5621 domain-containing protein n=1 Tax=Legionella cardiaca TaxID=1071983 RepID=A0ABY8AT73_9GAMM|nr:DUF5621 domain-containing protein [Legionella cardiaca]WED43862.1 DUF5621 domain-containing protein [Legionella cardiaca]